MERDEIIRRINNRPEGHRILVTVKELEAAIWGQVHLANEIEHAEVALKLVLDELKRARKGAAAGK